MKERRIRIGNQTSHTARDLLSPFDYAIEQGFDAFEWFPDRADDGRGWEEADLGPGTREMIRAAAARHDIRLSVHAPWRVDLTQPEGRRRAWVSLQLALDVGASILVTHLYEAAGIEAYVSGLVRFLDRLRAASVRLAIENTPQTGPEAFNALFARLRGVRPSTAARVGMCLDLGHANLAADTRNDFLQFVDRLGPQVPVVHIHLHENYGDADTHLPLFTGPAAANPLGIARFLERMKTRRYAGAIILEQWPDPPSQLDRARARLLDILHAHTNQGTVRNRATMVKNGQGQNETGSTVPFIERT
jgi:sugar phosphate isomerase/epimerase